MRTLLVVAVVAACHSSRPAPSYPLRPAVACTTSSTIAVLGAVQRPGNYDCSAGMHLADAVAVAGGMTPLAYANGVVLGRGNVRYRVRLGAIVEGEAPDPELGPGDLVFVGARDD